MSGVDGGGLTAEERDTLRDWWDEETTVGVESAFPIIVRLIAARVAAAEQRAERVTAAARALADEYQQALDAGPTRSSDERRMVEQVVADLREALADLAPRQYDDGGPRVREAVERAERDAEVAARALREAAADPEVIEAVQWRITHYGPLDAQPFQWSRYESPAHAALSVLRDRADALEGGEDRG